MEPLLTRLKARIQNPQGFIQVLLGPRQVGKTTAAEEVLKDFPHSHYLSADNISAAPQSWLLEPWQEGIKLGPRGLLVLDEIQKVANWAEQIKELWDSNKKNRPQLLLLGSSSLAIQIGLSESLTGRFESLRAYHWNYFESQNLKKFSVDEYLVFGGYPGSYRLTKDFRRWSDYIRDSIIETVLGRDLLLLRRVAKPALFRQCFELICRNPAQVISYTKLLGQLQDRGNTDLVRHYIELFEGAFLVRALEKYSKSPLRVRSSSPKLIPLCPALISYFFGPELLRDSELKGRVFESVVGAELSRLPGNLYYWREGDEEVDYVYEQGRTLIAVEVKTGRRKYSGLESFLKRYPKARACFLKPDDLMELTKNPEKLLGLS